MKGFLNKLKNVILRDNLLTAATVKTAFRSIRRKIWSDSLLKTITLLVSAIIKPFELHLMTKYIY